MKKIKRLLVLLICLVTLFGCNNDTKKVSILDENDEKLSSQLQEYYQTSGKQFLGEYFQCKISSANKVVSEDGSLTYYQYKGYIAPLTDSEITINSFEAVPANVDFFTKITTEGDGSEFAYPSYFPEACTVQYLYNNSFTSKEQLLAYKFEFVVIVVNERIREPYYSKTVDDFEKEMFNLTIVVDFNNQKEEIKLTYPNINEVSIDTISQDSLLYKDYNQEELSSSLSVKLISE